MQIGQLYSCKWTTSIHSDIERGWDMLLFLGIEPVYCDKDKGDLYLFYDILRGSKCVLDEGLIKNCKEITKEDSCTQ